MPLGIPNSNAPMQLIAPIVDSTLFNFLFMDCENEDLLINVSKDSL